MGRGEREKHSFQRFVYVIGIGHSGISGKQANKKMDEGQQQWRKLIFLVLFT